MEESPVVEIRFSLVGNPRQHRERVVEWRTSRGSPHAALRIGANE